MSGEGPPRVFRLEVGAKGVERDVDAEIEFHLAMRTRKLIANGMSPDQARQQALRRFGDLPKVRDQCLTIDQGRERAMKHADRFTNLRHDVVYAVRTLWQRRGFTTVLLLILALGIGANTATFTVIDALLLRTLPVPHSEELVSIGDPSRTGAVSEGTPGGDIASFPVYADVRDQKPRPVRGLRFRTNRALGRHHRPSEFGRLRRRRARASSGSAGLGELLCRFGGAGLSRPHFRRR